MNRRKSHLRGPLRTLCVLCVFHLPALDAAPPNVLFIAIDDLRPALACYGDPVAVTPHIDRLAARGLLFDRAYCQEAVCNPSRASLMTGLRPDTTRVWDLKAHFRDALPDVVTLPGFFRQKGYTTASIGKIYHGSGKPSKDPPSWSIDPVYDYVRDPNLRYARPENLEGSGLKRAASEAADVPDNRYADGLVCDAALQRLDELTQQDAPFFLAVGFRKPHLPFCAPKKYWDLYDRKKIPAPASLSHPEAAPEFAVRSWKELEGYTDIPEDGKLSREKIDELRHGYYACVSYVDALVGRLLDRLDESGRAADTVVCLWGDHGFHLGEQGLWAKANNYELSTRVPLIIAAPGRPHTGARTRALVELVDVYPTLADLCGFPVPGGLEGISLARLFEDPERKWKTAAFSQYPRAREGHRHRGQGDIMGCAIRTARFRYVEWRDWKTGGVLGRELYDHDSDATEMRNLARHPERRPEVERLSNLLEKGWPAALPPGSQRKEGNAPSSPKRSGKIRQ